MSRNERIKTIIDTLKFKNVISIKELAYKLNVSEMTIRRDLNSLSKDDIVELIPGGAILKPSSNIELDDEKYLITNEETRRTKEKIKIGKRSAQMIEPNDTIVIDVGSTTEFIAKFIPQNIKVTVLCYALNILVEIYRNHNCKPIFAGGYFHDNTLMFESQEGINLIKRTRADKAFISAAGVNEKLGVTCANHYEIETKKAVIGSSKTKILVVDSTKFGKVKSSYFADMKDFDIIITDNKLDDEYKKIIDNLGIRLIIA